MIGELSAKFLVCLGLAIALTGCGSGSEGQSSTLKLLYWQAPTILNPHLSTGFKDAEAARITLEPLASFNNEGELVPFLADRNSHYRKWWCGRGRQICDLETKAGR